MLNEALARELTDLTDEDLRLQPGALGDDPAAQLAHRRVTVRNADRLTVILDEHGWPTPALVGPEGARRAWLIAQHADRQLDVQRRALALMTAAGADPTQVAMLHDRVRVNEGHPQTYGTQIAGVADGAPAPWPCDDPAGMEQRRAAVGLAPYAEYVARHAPPAL
ncbi:DUF6624 domain-containing protein [Actinoplanes derwentensis]|uniref:Uncharacterized protein n=1 Tax=Actinoplanes derwentensis TaxID=113562 RepID=A0A1H1WMC4_9ACTN|nr:DUF6624 domain-containing protein [Actinoplanes derwentensis]GID87048.1 hypothetical protein Ade03nite_59720 [Actinoplanes derwentensis]SDS98323.1 hypothetical protein SAMN04489716_2164 [Actinoplanes derwentensis]